MIPVSKTLETDIAVVGGGIGGLCAAIAAAEGGARVMVLEKANTKRSGSGRDRQRSFRLLLPEAPRRRHPAHPARTARQPCRAVP